MKVGTVKIEVNEFESLVRENEKLQQKVKAISGLVMSEHISASKRGWGASVGCDAMARVLGITLPVIKKEGEEDEEQI